MYLLTSSETVVASVRSSIDKRVRKNNVQRIIETVFRPSIPWKNHSCYGRVFYMLVCDIDVWVIWGDFASQTASWLVQELKPRLLDVILFYLSIGMGFIAIS